MLTLSVLPLKSYRAWLSMAHLSLYLVYIITVNQYIIKAVIVINLNVKDGLQQLSTSLTPLPSRSTSDTWQPESMNRKPMRSFPQFPIKVSTIPLRCYSSSHFDNNWQIQRVKTSTNMMDWVKREDKKAFRPLRMPQFWKQCSQLMPFQGTDKSN